MIQTDVSIIDAYRQSSGEREFEKLYEAGKNIVWSVCFRILRDEDDARDAFQSAWRRIVEEIRSNDSISGIPFEKIAARCAVREAENLRKRRSRRSNYR